MGRRTGWWTALPALAVLAGCSERVTDPAVYERPPPLLGGSSVEGPGAEWNEALQWNRTALDAISHGTLGPPLVARALAIVHTAMYDAWAAYDEVAVGTRLGGTLRRPAALDAEPDPTPEFPPLRSVGARAPSPQRAGTARCVLAFTGSAPPAHVRRVVAPGR